MKHCLRFKLLALLLGVAGLTSCSTMSSKPEIKTASHVDLPKYMGKWRVIANIPYFAEKGKVDSIEGYELRPDGKIHNTFEFRKTDFAHPYKKMEFTAEVVNKQTNAEWRVKFLPFLKVAYLVLEVDPSYQWTIVGHPSRKYGWIMAREKSISDELYNSLLTKVAAHGYDPKKFVKVPQSP